MARRRASIVPGSHAEVWVLTDAQESLKDWLTDLFDGVYFEKIPGSSTELIHLGNLILEVRQSEEPPPNSTIGVAVSDVDLIIAELEVRRIEHDNPRDLGDGRWVVKFVVEGLPMHVVGERLQFNARRRSVTGA